RRFVERMAAGPRIGGQGQIPNSPDEMSGRYGELVRRTHPVLGSNPSDRLVMALFPSGRSNHPKHTPCSYHRKVRLPSFTSSMVISSSFVFIQCRVYQSFQVGQGTLGSSVRASRKRALGLSATCF